MVIDNKSGAGGVLGTMAVVRSTPDGHTILMGNIGPQSIAGAEATHAPCRGAAPARQLDVH